MREASRNLRGKEALLGGFAGEDQPSGEAVAGEGLQVGGVVFEAEVAHAFELRGGGLPTREQREGGGVGFGRGVERAFTGAAEGLRQRGTGGGSVRAELQTREGGEEVGEDVGREDGGGVAGEGSAGAEAAEGPEPGFELSWLCGYKAGQAFEQAADEGAAGVLRQALKRGGGADEFGRDVGGAERVFPLAPKRGLTVGVEAAGDAAPEDPFLSLHAGVAGEGEAEFAKTPEFVDAGVVERPSAAGAQGVAGEAEPGGFVVGGTLAAGDRGGEGGPESAQGGGGPVGAGGGEELFEGGEKGARRSRRRGRVGRDLRAET